MEIDAGGLVYLFFFYFIYASGNVLGTHGHLLYCLYVGEHGVHYASA